MRLDGLFADVKGGGDFLVGQPFGKMADHIQFPFAENWFGFYGKIVVVFIQSEIQKFSGDASFNPELPRIEGLVAFRRSAVPAFWVEM